MILCSCTILTRDDIADAVSQMIGYNDQHEVVITPGKLFNHCDREVRCGHCAHLIDRQITDEVTRHGRCRRQCKKGRCV